MESKHSFLNPIELGYVSFEEIQDDIRQMAHFADYIAKQREKGVGVEVN